MPLLEQARLVTPGIHRVAPRSPSRLELRFAREGDCTRMFVLEQEPPWRAIRAFRNARDQALVHLHNVSGGILSGDSLHLCIDAAPSTRVQVTSVGATRIYRQAPGPPDRLVFARPSASATGHYWSTCPMPSFRSLARASASPPLSHLRATPDLSDGKRLPRGGSRAAR